MEVYYYLGSKMYTLERGWVCDLVEEHMLNMKEALGSKPGILNKIEKNGGERRKFSLYLMKCF